MERIVYTVKEVNETTTAYLRCALVLVGPYPSLQEFSHLIFYRIVPSIPFLSLSHKIHATPAPRLNPGRIDGRRRWGCFRVGKRHGVRFTSRLLRRYVTRTEPERGTAALAAAPSVSLAPHFQVRRQHSVARDARPAEPAAAGSIAEEVKMRGRAVKICKRSKGD
jgi:hypothetical protein